MLNTEELSKVVKELLQIFRKGIIQNPEKEEKIINSCMKEVYRKWDDKFLSFPKSSSKRRTISWELERGKRDQYLIDIITKNVTELEKDENIILNAACVFGRHAKAIAKKLKNFKIIGTDINSRPVWNFFSKLFKKQPQNYSFIRDNIFQSKLDIRPRAVVFFGACGSVSDGIMDYAIKTTSPFLICRTCCHDNIGGNTKIAKKSSFLNFFFRCKNWYYEKRKKANAGDYFSEKYSSQAYPRSTIVKQLSTTKEYMELAKNSVNSDICRILIDLDRCCYLIEHGYSVLYKEELFFAKKI